MRRYGERAFTLIELVIVISIIGILAAIAIPRFIDIRAQAYDAQSNGVISAVRSGILLVASRNQVLTTGQGPNTFPPDLEAEWGTGNPGGTQAPPFPDVCTAVNPCFELVIPGGVIDANWSQTGATQYTFTPPIAAALTRVCNFSGGATGNGTFLSTTATDNCP